MTKRTITLTGLFCLLMIGLFAVANPTIFAASIPDPQAQSAVHEAWLRADESGAYSYQTDIRQTSHPVLSLANVGRSPETERLYIEGQIDTGSETMEMKLWSQGGSVAFGAGAIEIKVENGKAYGRTTGGAWQEVEDVASLFAPGRDPLGFLNAAKGITLPSPVPAGSGRGRMAPCATPLTWMGSALPTPCGSRCRARWSARASCRRACSFNSSPIIGHDRPGEIWLDSRPDCPCARSSP